MTGLRPLAVALAERSAAGNRVVGPGTIAAGVLAAALAAWVFVAGSPEPLFADTSSQPVAATVEVEVDLGALPQPTVDPAVARIEPGIDGSRARELAERLARDLAVEAAAFMAQDPTMLEAADFGPRLNEMQQRMRIALESGAIPVSSYSFDSLHLVIALPQGPQGGAVRGFEAEGILETVIYDLAGDVVEERSAPFDLTFSMENRGDLWHIFHVVPTP
jgi:hypothetical protein